MIRSPSPIRAAIVLLSILVWPAAAAAQVREINVTADSPRGWAPSPQQDDEARAAARAFLDAVDSGRATEAYALQTDRMQVSISPAAFTDAVARFAAEAGAVIERRITKLTWTKDPPGGAPAGTYAAIDIVSRFARVDRHCGYLVLFQPPGGIFKVARREETYLDNATARKIERDGSKRGLDAAWAQASAVCPNYSATPAAVELPPLAEASGASIGFPSVAAALANPQSKSGYEISDNAGWLIASEAATRTLWSFTPKDHPAHPSAVKRQLVTLDGTVQLQMAVQCEASKAACDQLVRDFIALNAKITAPGR